MKKTKKLLALVLAIVMAFAMLAIPAAAHGDEDEGIMPLYVVGKCSCGGTITSTSRVLRTYSSTVYSCPAHPGHTHTHSYTEVYHLTSCDSCTYSTERTSTDESCNFPL